MRFVEWARNQIETNAILSRAFDRMGRASLYRRLVFGRLRRRVEFVKTRKAYGVMIEVSSLCNAKCVFCPNRSLKRKRQVMDQETFERIVDKMRSEGIDPPTIDLFDVGEPLLDRDLFSRIRRLKALFPKAAIRTTTNLALADEDTIRQILDCGLASIHVSLNAARAETYKALTGLDFDKTASSLRNLIEKRNAERSALKITLSMVMCAENADEEALFLKEWSGKVDWICLQRAVDWGGEVGIESPYRASKSLYPCRDLFDRIVFLSNGEIALCCLDAEGLIGLNIADHGILELFYSEIFAKMRQQHLQGDIRAIRQCRNCFAVHSNGANWLFR